MDDATLKALTHSIEKWERNAVAEAPQDFTTGPGACHLCKLFWRWDCGGCPVMDRTGQMGCVGSPYVDAYRSHGKWIHDPSDPTRRDAAHAAARAEVKFLRALLPKAEMKQ